MASGISLAFTGKKQQRRVKVQEKNDDSRREAVVGFGADGLRTAEPKQQGQGALIIPKLENTYRAGSGKFKPSYIPEAADRIDAQGIDKFEAAAPDLTAKEPVAYGLQQRERPQLGNGEAAEAHRPTLDQQQQQQEQRQHESEAEVLKRDLAELPPEAPIEAYEAMPVDKFGEALLRGMGWKEGHAIGRAARADVIAQELVRRPQRLGLGATPAPDTHQKKYIKPGETRGKKDLVYINSEGHIKSAKPVDEKLVERKKEGVHPGKVMHVVEGRHRGLMCEVLSLEPKEEGRSERARVRLLPSHETVTVRSKELGERGEAVQDDREAAQQRGMSKRERETDRGDAERDKKQRGGSAGAAGLTPRGPDEGSHEETPWLAPNIRVKVVDKKAREGRLYLKKGVVVDVSRPTVCDVMFPETRETVQHLRQSQLETVVPAQEGVPLLILLGTLRGRRGQLLKRNTETGLAAVQLSSDLSVHRLSLDDVAEYVGGVDDD